MVWATRFPLQAQDATHQRRQIAETIQGAIVDRMGKNHAPVERFKARPEAYLAYLAGLQSMSQLSLPALRRARRHFRDALRLDRGMAGALAGLSRTLTLEWVLTAHGDMTLLLDAQRFAKRAIEIDGQCAIAFKELGVSQLYQGGIDDSLSALGEAERSEPALCRRHFQSCRQLDPMRAIRAPRLKNSALQSPLNPIPPDTYFPAAAGASYFLEEFQQALSFIECMQDKKPAKHD